MSIHKDKDKANYECVHQENCKAYYKDNEACVTFCDEENNDAPPDMIKIVKSELNDSFDAGRDNKKRSRYVYLKCLWSN